MDQHYDSQILSKVSSSATTFRGPARQYGSGGLGAFAMRMGRVAVPLVKKYFVPVAEFGRNLVSAFVPEIPKIVAGKKAAPESVERIIEKVSRKNCQNICCSIHPTHFTRGRQRRRRLIDARPGGQAAAGAAQIRCSRVEKERKATILPF